MAAKKKAKSDMGLRRCGRSLIILSVLLSSCGDPSPKSAIEMGNTVDPPQGFVEYCNRNPAAQECSSK